MKEIIFNSNTFNENVELFGTIFECDKPKGIIEIVHGMAEHQERYFNFANFLSNNGYITVIYDQRGHGKTCKGVDKQGYMSNVDNFEAMVEDVKLVNDKIKELYPNLNVYLFGHSMGSFISQRYIEKFPETIKGVILSGSNYTKSILYSFGRLIAKRIVKKKGREFKSTFLDKMSFGSYNNAFKPNRTDYDWLSMNEENVDKYINDEYCGTLFSASYFMDLLYGFKKISSYFSNVPNDLPMFIFSGKKDPVGNMGKGVVKLFDAYKKKGVKDIDINLYNGRHEMLNEKNNETVFYDVLKWLNNH